MGRLIDAEALKAELRYIYEHEKDVINSIWKLNTILDRVDEIPHAFDVDKVVDQLNDKFRVVRTDADLEWNRAMDEAITIVEGGGVDG